MMTSLLSRLAVGGALVAALGAGVAPIATAAPAPAVNCSEGNVLKEAFATADHDGIAVVFNLHCKAAVQEATYLNPGEKPAQEGSGDPIAVKGKAFVRVIINNYNAAGDTYSGPKRIQGEGAVTEIVHGGYHAGQSTWYVGVDKKRAFTKTVEGKSVSLYFNLV